MVNSLYHLKKTFIDYNTDHLQIDFIKTYLNKLFNLIDFICYFDIIGKSYNLGRMQTK